MRQSQRLARYDEVLAALRAEGRLFACDCSRARRSLSGAGGEGIEAHCVGECRSRRLPEAEGTALRVALEDLAPLEVEDRSLGPIAFDPRRHRDLIVRRRDGLHAYHLAVIVDDRDCSVTDVVRGADLLEATPWQLGLVRALGWQPPRYLHLPLVTEPDGAKLAKSRRSLPLEVFNPGRALLTALALLDQPAPATTPGREPRELLESALQRWDPARFRGRRTVALRAGDEPYDAGGPIGYSPKRRS